MLKGNSGWDCCGGVELEKYQMNISNLDVSEAVTILLAAAVTNFLPMDKDSINFKGLNLLISFKGWYWKCEERIF